MYFVCQEQNNTIYSTLNERKLRMPQIQGIRGRSCSRLPRALGNEGDGVSSAFPQGEQNRDKIAEFIFRY
jgi:hypothetical protein